MKREVLEVSTNAKESEVEIDMPEDTVTLEIILNTSYCVVLY